ncbi:MAG: GAF domain-containing SpoIIE family protein phosphatase, partial [bacterium]
SIDAIINSCLKDLGEVKHIDRSYVFLLSKYGNKISNSHEWCREGILSHKDDLQSLNFDKTMPSTRNALSKDNIFQVSIRNDYSKLTRDEILMMEYQSIQSFLLVGLKNEDKLMGFVGFDAVHLPYEWTIEDISLLQLFADLLSFALLNVNFQKELIEKDKSLHEFYDRMNDDLEIAKETQKNLVSLDFPNSSYYKLTSYFRPFEKVGGDIISYHMHDDYIDLMFGDVSGHGISSAMVSGMVILSFRNSSRLNESPAQILLSMNRDLKTIVLNHHISAACARFYFKERKLVYSYAGHPPLVLINEDKFEELPGMNTPLLTLENIEYFEKDLILSPGSRLVFYSDGCYEIFNRDRQLLGLYPFFEILKRESHSKDAARFIQNSILQILNFCSGDIKDDLTMLVLDVN